MGPPPFDPAVAIVVPARNAVETIGLVVEDVRRQDPQGVHMVVVDDASTDGTAAAVARLAVDLPWLSVVKGGGGGPAAARNAGARATSAPWLAFVDADVRLDTSWLRNGLAHIAAGDSDVIEGIVMPRGGADRGMVLHTASSTADGVFVTANLWVRREVFDRVGGFDEAYRVPWREDTDLGWRLLDAGARARSAPDVTVYHPFTRRPVRALLREGPRLEADARLRSRFPERFRRLLPRRGYRTTYAAVIALLALVVSVAVGLPVAVEVALAVVAELLALLAVRGAVVDRQRPRPAEWAALAAVAPAACVLRVGWVLRSNAAHRQWFW
jgi:glycosyltransferase involved in cell wall biosynthesis